MLKLRALLVFRPKGLNKGKGQSSGLIAQESEVKTRSARPGTMSMLRALLVSRSELGRTSTKQTPNGRTLLCRCFALFSRGG